MTGLLAVVDWTWHAGDVILAAIGGVITLVLIPAARALFQMRDTLLIIAPKVNALEPRVQQHHEWLILLRGKNGS